ncbi:FAD binding domain [Parelaphostrongylus tenuis]|uniref:Methionine synthase reductase n=1 Tax=Parelaphostrongylus tenuis TaxID=148309 RepID=A0AAD5QSL5_PARTN|nr:FAD binding domain [Parelaphostrongylus tenuis]
MTAAADFLILYGSHTGQAESISKQIKERSEILGMKPRLYTLDENEKQFFIQNEPLVVIVVSSTGDGDPPENASRFVRRIMRRNLESDFLQKLDYALLGLGDSNYSTFQGVPNRIDKQLRHLGARPIIEIGHADDQVGLEVVVEPWIERLFEALITRFNLNVDVLKRLTTKIEIPEKKELPDVVNDQNVLESKTAVPILAPQPYDYPPLSLISGNDKLSNDPALRVPVAPQEFVSSSVSHLKWTKNSETPWQNGAKMVGVASEPYDVTVVGTARLTDADVVKPKYELVLDFGDSLPHLSYEPGDAFYFVFPNPLSEVNFILKRMDLLNIADQVCNLSVDETTNKINAVLPAHVPSGTSLRHIFTYCLDIRRTPGRPILRSLAEKATDEREKRRLLELTSAQGLADFNNFVRQPGLSLADILFAFPSVRPSVDRLIELLPRLIPRSYSVSSCRGRRVRFIYSVMSFSAEDGRRYERKGLATEWLLNLRVGDTVQIMRKEPARFRLPPPPLMPSSALQMPLLMVGPGTGVAVFLAFCQYLLNSKLNNPQNFPDVPRYLYFACRNLEKDALHIDEMKSYVREGILTELILCESCGQDGRPRYVQDALRQKIRQVCEFLGNSSCDNPSRVFVCGDAKGMSKDVWQCFHDIIKEGMNKSDVEAKLYMTELRNSDRYIEDVWS